MKIIDQNPHKPRPDDVLGNLPQETSEYHGDKFLKNMQLMLTLRAQELKEKYFELEKARFSAKIENDKNGAALRIFAGFEAQIEPPLAKSLTQNLPSEAISPSNILPDSPPKPANPASEPPLTPSNSTD